MADGGQDFNLGHVVGGTGPKGDKGDTGATGNGIQSIILRSTVGKVKTYRITYTNGDTFDFQVTDGEDGSGATVEIVTSWNSTPSDEKIPSEKLTKDTLDGKAPTSHASSSSTYGLGTTANYGHVKTINGLTQSSHSNGTALSAYQGKVLKDAIDAKPDSSDIPTKTSDLTNDSNYISTSSTSGLIKNDGTIDTTSYSTFSGSYNDLSNKPTIPSASSTTPSADTTSGSYGSGTSYARSNHTHPKSSLYAESSHTHTKSQITDFPSLSTVATSGSYSDLSNKPSIPSSSSDLSDGSSLVKTSSTTGLLKNDGTVDTTTYLSSLPSHNHDDRYYTESEVDTALSGKQATLVSGTNIKTVNNESLLGSGNITIQGGSSVDIVTAWESTPSDSKVASEKLVKDTLDTKIAQSSTSGLVKNDGTIDTSAYITSSAISGMLTTSDVANNLTTTSSGKVLDARQGKALADLIGDAITYINQ